MTAKFRPRFDDQIRQREDERDAAQRRIKEFLDRLDNLMSKRRFFEAEQQGSPRNGSSVF